MPVVVLGLNHGESCSELASEWVEDLFSDHQVSPQAHFRVNKKETAEESLNLLSKQTIKTKSQHSRLEA